MSPPAEDALDPRLHREGARRLGFFAVGLMLMLYALAYIRIYPVAGDATAALFLFPVVAAAWFFGVRGGVALALVGLPLHYGLGVVVGAPLNLLGASFSVLVGAALGWSRDLYARVRDQSHELERERRAREAQGELRTTTESLAQRRARQVATLADLAQAALKGAPLDELQRRATHGAAEGLETDFADLLEYAAGQERFVFRGIHGASEDLLGRSLSAGKGSHSGYTLLVGQPVVVEDYASDARFHIPIASKQYRLVSGLCVVVGDPLGQAWGTLSVYTKTRRVFDAHDVNFLQAVAGIVGFAITARHSEAARCAMEPLSAIGVVAVSAAEEIVAALEASSPARASEAARRIRRTATVASDAVLDVDRAVEEALAVAVARASSDVVARLTATHGAQLGRGELAQLVVDLVVAAKGEPVSVRTFDEDGHAVIEVVTRSELLVPASAHVAETKGARLSVASEPGRSCVKVLLPRHSR